MVESANSRSTLASVPDTDLDAYIADLIVQKSRAKDAQSQSPLHKDDSKDAARVPNTNKRFLASVIRNVEGHNQALLRQQASEERVKAGKDRRPDEACGSSAEPSKLRGWSDDEDEGAESGSTGSDRRDEVGELEGLSSKMDRYFERDFDDADAGAPDPQSLPLQVKDRSKRAREKEREGSNRRTSQHERDRVRHTDSKSRASRNAERQHDESRRHNKDTRHRGESEHRHRSSSTSTSSRHHRSRRHDDSSDDSEQRKRRRGGSSRSKHHDRERYHRSRREGERKRSASPTVEPPKQVRQWDLGKDSLAF